MNDGAATICSTSRSALTVCSVCFTPPISSLRYSFPWVFFCLKILPYPKSTVETCFSFLIYLIKCMLSYWDYFLYCLGKAGEPRPSSLYRAVSIAPVLGRDRFDGPLPGPHFLTYRFGVGRSGPKYMRGKNSGGWKFFYAWCSPPPPLPERLLEERFIPADVLPPRGGALRSDTIVYRLLHGSMVVDARPPHPGSPIEGGRRKAFLHRHAIKTTYIYV